LSWFFQAYCNWWRHMLPTLAVIFCETQTFYLLMPYFMACSLVKKPMLATFSSDSFTFYRGSDILQFHLITYHNHFCFSGWWKLMTAIPSLLFEPSILLVWLSRAPMAILLLYIIRKIRRISHLLAYFKLPTNFSEKERSYLSWCFHIFWKHEFAQRV